MSKLVDYGTKFKREEQEFNLEPLDATVVVPWITRRIIFYIDEHQAGDRRFRHALAIEWDGWSQYEWYHCTACSESLIGSPESVDSFALADNGEYTFMCGISFTVGDWKVEADVSRYDDAGEFVEVHVNVEKAG